MEHEPMEQENGQLVLNSDSTEETDPKDLQQELQDCRHRELRLKADFENYRRRTSVNMEEERLKYKQLFGQDLLEVIDNFERALESNLETVDQSFMAGMAAIQHQLCEVLRRHGITSLELAVGAPFNPNSQEVLDMVDDPALPPLSVKKVYQRGYLFNGKVIRPAKVQVVREY